MNLIKKIWAFSKISAQIAKKQIKIKKLEMRDLKTCYKKLGQYAVENKLGRDQAVEQFEAIEALDVKVKRLREHRAVSDTASFGDKAKRAATITENKAAAEGLMMGRKRLIVDMGKVLHEKEVKDETVINFQQDAQYIESHITELKGEISDLEQKVSGVEKKPLYLLCAAAILMLLFVREISGTSSGESYSEEAHAVSQEVGKNMSEEERVTANPVDARDQIMLGAAYHSGSNDLEKDVEKAKYWYSKAAEQGDETAQILLGLTFFAENNFDEAYKWFLKSADQGAVTNGTKISPFATQNQRHLFD